MKGAARTWLALVALGAVAMLAERTRRAEARAEAAEAWAETVAEEVAIWMSEVAK